MIETRKDRELLIKATECLRDSMPIEMIDIWLSRPDNVMFISDDNVGIASYQYSGLYIVHWYYQSARGRKAIDLGKKMCGLLFTEHGAVTLMGIIKKKLPASRWACRQLGFKSHGFLTYADGDENEIFFATKDEFMKGLSNG